MSIQVEISKTSAVFFFNQFHCRKWLQTFACATKTTNKRSQFCIHSLESGAKMMLFAVEMTESSANRLFKTELHFRSIIW